MGLSRNKSSEALVFFALLLILLAPLALAHEQGFTSGIVERGQKLQGKELPGFAAAIFGTERINVYISSDDGDLEFVSLVTEDKKIKSVQEGQSEDATLNLYISEETIKKIDDSQDVVGAAQKALESKEITYEAIGFFNKIKFGFLSFIFSIFGGSDSKIIPLPNETKIIVNQTITQASAFSFTDPNNPTEEELLKILEGKKCREASGPHYTSTGSFVTTDVGTLSVSNGDCLDLYNNRKLLLLWYFPKDNKDNSNEASDSVKLDGIKAYLFENGKLIDSYLYKKIGELEIRKYSQIKPDMAKTVKTNISTAIQFKIESAKLERNGKALLRVLIGPDAVIDYSGNLKTTCKQVTEKLNKKKGVLYYTDLEGKDHEYGSCPLENSLKSTAFSFIDPANPSEEELRNIIDGKECKNNDNTFVNGDCINLNGGRKLLLIWYFPKTNSEISEINSMSTDITDTESILLNGIKGFILRDGKLVDTYLYSQIGKSERRTPETINSKDDKDRGFSAARDNILEFTIKSANLTKEGKAVVKVEILDNAVKDPLDPSQIKTTCKLIPDPSNPSKTIAMKFYTDLEGVDHPEFQCQGGGPSHQYGDDSKTLACKDGNVVIKDEFYSPTCVVKKLCSSYNFTNCEQRSVCGVNVTQTKYSDVQYTCKYGCTNGLCNTQGGSVQLLTPKDDQPAPNRFCGGTDDNNVLEKNNDGSIRYIKGCSWNWNYNAGQMCGWDPNSKEYSGYSHDDNKKPFVRDYQLYTLAALYDGKCVNGACVYSKTPLKVELAENPKSCTPEKQNYCSRTSNSCVSRDEGIAKGDDVPVLTCYFAQKVDLFSSKAPEQACNQPSQSNGVRTITLPSDATEIRAFVAEMNKAGGCPKLLINKNLVYDPGQCSSCKEIGCDKPGLVECKEVKSFDLGIKSISPSLKSGSNEFYGSALGVGRYSSYMSILVVGKYKAKKCDESLMDKQLNNLYLSNYLRMVGDSN